MTNASEVVVSDAEILIFAQAGGVPFGFEELKREKMRQALAAFLAKRVPDANIERDDINDESGAFTNGFSAGFNACRAKVLRGEE